MRKGLSLTPCWSSSPSRPASDSGLPITNVPPGKLTLTIPDESLAPNDEVEVTATLVDDNGDPVVGVDCTFSIFSQPGDDATVDPGPVTTDADGKASTTLNVGSTPGIVEVQADCNGFSQLLDVTVSPSLPATGAALEADGGFSVGLWAMIGALVGATAAALSLYGWRYDRRR